MIRIFAIVRNRPFHWRLKEPPNNEKLHGRTDPKRKNAAPVSRSGI